MVQGLSMAWRSKSYSKRLLLFLQVKKMNTESSCFSLLALWLSQCQTVQEFLVELIPYSWFWYGHASWFDPSLHMLSLSDQSLLSVDGEGDGPSSVSESHVCPALCSVLRGQHCWCPSRSRCRPGRMLILLPRWGNWRSDGSCGWPGLAWLLRSSAPPCLNPVFIDNVSE